MTKNKVKIDYKICSACGAENPKDVIECKECQSGRFEPDWVLAKGPITRNSSVQITRSNPEYGDTKKRITLSKWWPGGSATYHINNISSWEKITSIVENKLLPKLDWESSGKLVKKIKSNQNKATEQKEDYQDLFRNYPDFLKQLVEAIDPEKLGKDDFNSVLEAFEEISRALGSANAGFREAFLSIIKKLPKQKKRALEDLDLLLQGWSLQVITNVAQQVRSRLETIELFEKQVNDPRTYEIIGDNSIHRILERAMWLVDERYWLMYSNTTLRKQIGEEMSKKDKKKYGKKRPDFVCGTYGNKLIIMELKRPSHTLKIEDLNQLETYVIVAEDYSNFRSYEAYLVGNKKDDELVKTLKHRSNSFKVLTYSDLLQDTKQRYSDFLKSIE